MSCLRYKWCPECQEVIWDPICMCLGGCDKHPKAACTPIVPDGRHPYRENRKPKAEGEIEHRNGWEVGYLGWSKEGGNWSKWITREPGHPTKSPSQLQWEETEEKERANPFVFRIERKPVDEAGGSGI